MATFYQAKLTSIPFTEAQYSSIGVRDQTAELSSSFICDSDSTRRFSHDYSELYNSGGIGRHTGPIVERSEPVTPEAEIDARLQDSTELFSEYAISSTPGDDRSRTSPYILTTQPESTMRNPDVIVTQDGRGNRPSETTPLLPQARLSSIRKPPSDSAAKPERQMSSTPTGGPAGRLAAFTPLFKRFEQWSTVIRDPSKWDARTVAHELLVRPVSVLPAVFLGLLLNLLDALSYGIILFPLGEEVFSSMGPDGVSMFYVSCIVSQLVYSSGSVFRGGVGSEMVRSSLKDTG
jgi:SulP family sulfate permease